MKGLKQKIKIPTIWIPDSLL